MCFVIGLAYKKVIRGFNLRNEKLAGGIRFDYGAILVYQSEVDVHLPTTLHVVHLCIILC